MSVAITNSNLMQDSASGALTLTYAFDCLGGNYLIVPCRDDEAAGSITGVTYNGVPMTLLITQLDSNGTNRLNMFGLLNPPAGSNNVVVTRTGTFAKIYSCAASVSGARATQPANTYGGDNGISATTSGTIMTTTLDEGVFGYQLQDNGGDFAGPNTTIITQSAFGDSNFTRSTVFPTPTAQNVTLTLQSGLTGNTATIIVGIASTIPAVLTTDNALASFGGI